MRTIVIGGGIAGLTAAYRLRQRTPLDDEVLLLEGAPRTGGHATTTREHGFIVESGPNGFLERHGETEARTLIRELDLESAMIEANPAAKKRYLLRSGKLRAVPASPLDLVSTSALSIGGRMRLAREPFVPAKRDDAFESVYDFAARRIGAEAADVLVDTAIAGISAGDSRVLDVAAAFPQMVDMERTHGSLFRAMTALKGRRSRLVSLSGGMGTLTEALTAKLGDAVCAGMPVERLARTNGRWTIELATGREIEADRVLLATSANRAARMLSDLDPEFSARLGLFPAAGLSVVALAFRERDLKRPLDGYGYLVTRGEGFDTLGVVWESSLFAGRAPKGHVLVRAMLGGARRPQAMELDESAVAWQARREIAAVLDMHTAPLYTWTWRWPHAITQYTRGHLDRVAAVRSCLARYPGLDVCGTSYDGISFTSAIVSAERAAARVLAMATPERARADADLADDSNGGRAGKVVAR